MKTFTGTIAPIVVPTPPTEGVLYLECPAKAGFPVTTLEIPIFLVDFSDDAQDPRGAHARLNKLGYLPLSGPPSSAPNSAMTSEAIDGLGRFCRGNRLPLPSGSLIDTVVAQRLRDAHDTIDGRLSK